MSGVFEEKYFCAVNSGSGFISYYSEMCSAAERVFIIKGGPGTGKSSFMRRVSELAKKHGKNVKYYYCSSDPASLDAVLIDGTTLFLDGTPPHSAETELAGVKDNIIDLGAFWDCAKLIDQKKEIARLTSEKKRAFAKAYHFLAAAKETVLAKDEEICPCISREKLKYAAERMISKAKKGKEFTQTSVVTNSYGMRGSVYFNTLEKLSSERISVPNQFGASHIFLEQIISAAKEKKLAITVSRDPLIPERPDAVLVHSLDRLYFIGNGGDKSVNMLRFFDSVAFKEVKSRQKHLSSLTLELLDNAKKCFECAAEYHFSLEKIYGKAMDFALKEEFTDNFLSEMFI